MRTGRDLQQCGRGPFGGARRACFPREMLGKMSNKSRPSLIANAIGVLTAVALFAPLLFLYPVTMPEVLLRLANWLGYGVLMMAWVESRGFRNLVVGMIALPICVAAFVALPSDLARVIAALGLVAWLWFDGMLTPQEGKRLALFLAQILAAWAGLIVLVFLLQLMRRESDEFTSALFIWAISSAYLVWRLVAGPGPRDPWRWDRDSEGTWRA